MNFDIKYPPLVEQVYSHFLSIGLHPSKDKLYKMLVDEGMIDELCNPTQRAIDEGLIEVAGNDPIERFKAENPLVAHIPDEHFKVQNNQVLMDCYAVRVAATTILNDPTAPQEQKENAQSLLDEVNSLDHNEWH
ncbi:hypothetical protein DKZ22_07425 [Limosilactobacillus reuteri]|uniref:Uncharacterized protein n=1 Tax=Limosilactobacillus reuteri TaxID=1598 RepID=A0A855XM50_LIMRT|nr:hypothetical protein [Limosilactobacillus reuteri]PWT35168.1 hypothetical protein DKZ24_04910 [Limosilactobacillus reuteri]PWT40994.1 hypothetical protein DKZ22_07425 [Limosilactobacillus reuteri]PWT53815.1 hypothetical protein DKZ31_07545 [Limosilactobacillus reuteri]PWT59786.1 hypothetical protein DKZ30_04865 [Limosilactobacillus reuteri]PWT64487.1 hypothetical protein DKZ20_04950 [Limosilactobacillus reuteri]